MNRWITIVGIGEDGAEGLGTRAREVIANAEILIGGERHLALIPEGAAARANWGKDFEHGVAAIRAHEGKRVVVLASGDSNGGSGGSATNFHPGVQDATAWVSAGQIDGLL